MSQKTNFDKLISKALRILIEEDKRLYAGLEKNEVDKYLQLISEDLSILKKNAEEKKKTLSIRYSKAFRNIWETHKTSFYHLGEWIKKLLISDKIINEEELAALNEIPSEKVHQLIGGKTRTIESVSPKFLADIMNFFSIEISKLLLILRNEEQYFSGVLPKDMGFDIKNVDFLYTVFDKNSNTPQSRDIDIVVYFNELRKNLTEIGRKDLLN